MDESKSKGRKIKQLREQKGISSAELASQAGCSEEYLEWVEEGQVEPSVALLLQISRALKLGAGALLKEDEAVDRRKEEASKRTEHYSYKTLTPPDGHNHLMAFHVTIPPKTSHGGVGYSHEGEEFVYVTSGRVEVRVEEESNMLSATKSLHFDSSLDHHISNPDDTEAQLLVVLYVP